MIKLYENGVYLLNGTEIVEDTGSAQVSVSKEEAAKNTIAYGVLEAHNTSSDMKNLQIKFDKLTSHDITCLLYTSYWGTSGAWTGKSYCRRSARSFACACHCVDRISHHDACLYDRGGKRML